MAFWLATQAFFLAILAIRKTDTTPFTPWNFSNRRSTTGSGIWMYSLCPILECIIDQKLYEVILLLSSKNQGGQSKCMQMKSRRERYSPVINEAFSKRCDGTWWSEHMIPILTKSLPGREECISSSLSSKYHCFKPGFQSEQKALVRIRLHSMWNVSPLRLSW